MPDNYVTVADAQAATGYSREHIRELARTKKVPSKKIGPTVMVSLTHLEKHKRDADIARQLPRAGVKRAKQK